MSLVSRTSSSIMVIILSQVNLHVLSPLDRVYGPVNGSSSSGGGEDFEVVLSA